MKCKVFSSIFVLLITLQLYGQDRNIEVVNIENRAVQDYMADAAQTYPVTDYSVSVITKYNDSDLYGRKLFWPAGKTVTWQPSAQPEDIKEILISVGEKKDFRGCYTFHPDSKGADTYIIRNLLPKRTYYYKVEEILYDGTVTEKAKGVFRTEGQVRMIQVRGCSNVRDLGGWPTQYGVPVKYGRLYRSARLETITSEGIHDFVDNLKVVAELDLRSESKLTSSPLGQDKNFLKLTHGGYLSGITKRKWVYATDLRWINARLYENKNVDWHCAIGCDRCGTLSFLLEGLLGLSELDLCRDYELSTFMMDKKNKRVRSSLRDMMNYIKQFGPQDDLAQCFYNYWLSIGMQRNELDYFLNEMLGVSNISRITSKYNPNFTHTY